MTTPAPSKYVILVTTLGKYVWWPTLQGVDFIPTGKRSSGTNSPTIILTVKQNTEKEALKLAVKDLSSRLNK